MRVARRFFCADEVAALESCDIATQRDRFYDLWTLKEAAIKCRGAALASGLDAHGFALVFNSHPVTLGGRITVTSPDEAYAAHYCLLEPYPAYRMAICSSSGIDLRSQTQLFQLCQDGTITSLEVPLRASTWCV